MGHWYLLAGGVEDRSSMGADDISHVGAVLGHDIRMTVGSVMGIFM